MTQATLNFVQSSKTVRLLALLMVALVVMVLTFPPNVQKPPREEEVLVPGVDRLCNDKLPTLNMSQLSASSVLGNEGRYLLLPHDTKIQDVAGQFMNGQGYPMPGMWQPFTPSVLNNPSSSLFVVVCLTPSYYADEGPYIISAGLRDGNYNEYSAAWTSHVDNPDVLKLLGVAGNSPNEAAVRKDERKWRMESSIARFEVPNRFSGIKPVFFRFDSIQAYRNKFRIQTLEQELILLDFAMISDGIFLGAVAVAIAWALTGAIQKRSLDYLTFIIAIACLVVWYTIRYEATRGPDYIVIRRFLCYSPFYLYLLLNSIGVYKLIDYRSTVAARWRLGRAQHWAIIAAISLNFLCLAHTVLYSLYGDRALGVDHIEWLHYRVPLLSSGLVTLASLLSLRRNIPNVIWIIMTQSTGVIGAIAFLLFNTLPISRFTMNMLPIFTYALPIEALLWGIALSRRYAYIGRLEEQHVQAARDDTERRIRKEIAETTAMKDRTVEELHGSYDILKKIHGELVQIVSTYTHATGTILGRVARAVRAVGRNIDNDEAHTQLTGAGEQLEQAMEELAALESAATDIVTASGPSSQVEDQVTTQLSILAKAVAERCVSIDVRIDASARGARVAGFPLFESLRELFTNVERYAISNSIVLVEVTQEQGWVSIIVENEGILRDDDSALLQGRRVAPAAFTYNGDVSSGFGLANLGKFLDTHGGILRYTRVPPNRFRVEARLPLRRGT